MKKQIKNIYDETTKTTKKDEVFELNQLVIGLDNRIQKMTKDMDLGEARYNLLLKLYNSLIEKIIAEKRYNDGN